MAFVEEIREQPTDPLGGASGSKRRFSIEFLAKANNPEFPFTIANEAVATPIGIALGLNLPTVLTYRVGGEDLVFVQMIDRDPEMNKEPPVTARALKEYKDDHISEVHGAIVFDLFVANNDRAFGPLRRNLLLDADGRLLLYDQGNACYYRNRPNAGIEAGIPRLKAIQDDLGAMFDMSHKENHYFEFLTDWNLTEEWCGKIGKLPEFFLASVVERIPRYFSRPTKNEREELTRFLISRRTSLLDDIIRRQQLFKGLPKRGSHV